MIDSYIWDLNSPNEPCAMLTPPSPLMCVAYNPKSPDIIACGCHNGAVAIWDVRQKEPADLSDVA